MCIWFVMRTRLFLSNLRVRNKRNNYYRKSCIIVCEFLLSGLLSARSEVTVQEHTIQLNDCTVCTLSGLCDYFVHFDVVLKSVQWACEAFGLRLFTTAAYVYRMKIQHLRVFRIHNAAISIQTGMNSDTLQPRAKWNYLSFTWHAFSISDWTWRGTGSATVSTPSSTSKCEPLNKRSCCYCVSRRCMWACASTGDSTEIRLYYVSLRLPIYCCPPSREWKVQTILQHLSLLPLSAFDGWINLSCFAKLCST